VAIETDRTGEPERPVAAYFLFLRWRRMGQQGVDGHLETPYLAWGNDAAAAVDALGTLPLAEVRQALERCIDDVSGQSPPTRKWWDVMRDDA